MNRRIFLWLAPILGTTLSFYLQKSGITASPSNTAGITLWIAIWWILEVIPIPITSLIPFFAFPILGITSNKEVAQSYGHWLILLLMGGFMIAKGMESAGLHKRIAIHIMQKIGTNNSKRLLFGVMLAAAVLSAWISNTATTLMLLPVILAFGEDLIPDKNSCILLLGLAYGASIGGLATPIGTPPNVILMGIYETEFGKSIDFITWMSWGVPISVLLLLGCFGVLQKHLLPNPSNANMALPKLNPITAHEKRYALLFFVIALAWILKGPILKDLMGFNNIGDDSIALLGVFLLFVIPASSERALLTWEEAKDIPWGLLLLFGGGIAIAQAFQSSGLSSIIGEYLSSHSDLPTLILIVLICSIVTFLTEITSNTATTTLLLPLLAASAKSTGLDPLLLMLPAALSASCAFMLPVATAPNAIVFGSNKVPIDKMMRIGLQINIVGIIIISAFLSILYKA